MTTKLSIHVAEPQFMAQPIHAAKAAIHAKRASGNTVPDALLDSKGEDRG